MLDLLPCTRLLRHFREEAHIGEIDALEPPKLEEVDEHRDRKGGERPQEGRVQKGHRGAKIVGWPKGAVGSLQSAAAASLLVIRTAYCKLPTAQSKRLLPSTPMAKSAMSYFTGS